MGEFSFVLATTARQGGVLGADGYDLILSVIILLMLVAPYMVSQAFPVTDRIQALMLGKPKADILERQSETTEPSRKVLVVGLGPAGQAVANHLKERQVTYVFALRATPHKTAWQAQIRLEFPVWGFGFEPGTRNPIFDCSFT